MKKIYAFHGCDSKSGVTMLAQSCAQSIAQKLPDKNILLISLCGRRNNQFVKEDVESIDYFRNKIESGIVVSKNDIRESRIAENLFLLDGLEKESESRFYFPEAVKELLEGLQKEFDIIVADTGSTIDNGLAVGGLCNAERKYLVFSQNEAALSRYLRLCTLYDSLNLSFDGYVLNKFLEKDFLSVDYVRKRVGISKDNIFKVGDAGSLCSRRAELEKKTIFEMKNSEYINDIEKITFDILQHLGMGQVGFIRKKKWRDFI